MVNKALAAAFAVALAAVSFEAAAAEIKVEQKDKKFAESKVTAKVGDTLVFVNADGFTHNLFSKKDVTFDSGVMKPGDVYKLKLDAANKFRVRCAIHPKMKLRVEVE